MSRRKRDYKREVLPDPVYGDKLISKFINCMMWDGKRTSAETIFYSAIDLVAERAKKSGLEVFQDAVTNVRPVIEVRSRRVGGANYQIPTEVRPERRDTLAIRWLINHSRSRGEKGMINKLAGELMDASQGRGNAVKKKEDTHKMAEANRAFAHYRW